MSTRFFSKANFQHVLNVSRQFLLDKHNISVPDEEFRNAVAEEMKRIGPGTGEDIDILNKRAIIAMRNRYTAPASAATPSEPEPEPEPEEDEESMFLGKLRNLELQRTVVSMTTAIEPAEEPISTAPPPPPAPPTTIIFQGESGPRNTTISDIVIMNSFDRLWMYETERNSFICNHRFSRKVGVDGIAVTMVIIPKIDRSPFYQLQIKNAAIADNPSHATILLTPSGSCASTQWTYLIPVGTGIVQGVASPWIISLSDPQGRIVNMGRDGWVVQNVIKTQTGSFVCSFAGGGIDDLRKHFGTGDYIQVNHVDGDTLVHASVLNVKYGELELELLDHGAAVRQNGVILNMSRQITVMLSVTEKK